MPSVLLVCSANICRSPMAEAILKSLVADLPDGDQWHIASAGTWARNGAPAAILSQVVTQSMGMNISAHQSQPVTESLIRTFDLILTMEHQQKEGLVLQFKPYARRIFMLSEMVGLVEDIPDPIGGDLPDYKATASLIQDYLTRGLKKIRRLAAKHSTMAS